LRFSLCHFAVATHTRSAHKAQRAHAKRPTPPPPQPIHFPNRFNARHAIVELSIAQITRPKRDGGVKVVDMCWLEACIYAPHCE
jgi:hypothetical protein